MRLTVADPPYLGVAARHYGHQHPRAAEWDQPEAHIELLRSLIEEWDGFALACHQRGLRLNLAQDFLPNDVRIATWVKPSPGGTRPRVRVGFAVEFVLFRQPPSRRAGFADMRRADALIANSTRRVGVIGAKPAEWTRWVLDLIGYLPGEDEIVDMFPGSGMVTEAIEHYVPGCAFCGRYLGDDRRRSARFCSDRCRVAAHRRRASADAD